MLGTKTRTFSGNVVRTAHVATINETNLMLYGVLLTGDTEWLRICTTKIEDAEKIAFLSPGTYVGLKVRGNIPFQGTVYMEFHSLVLSV
ncbi:MULTISPECIES: hypothetical protein [Pantoea]|uniref:hypothetical protein n=1 Tax=Pantoea TaxID=53335 RepID=UPI0028AF021E|nr:hypothetical protein [Pantoea vagans]